jgi:hypothetical protein
MSSFYCNVFSIPSSRCRVRCSPWSSLAVEDPNSKLPVTISLMLVTKVMQNIQTVVTLIAIM